MPRSGRFARERQALVVNRGASAERGVSAMWVVPTFQPIKNRHLGFRLALEPPPVQYLALEGGEKALRHRVHKSSQLHPG